MEGGRRDRAGWRLRGSRGAAELLVTVVAAALIAGVLLGTGFAQTVLNATDGLTWLGDPARGEVVQVNPSTGRPETRLRVTGPGDGLAVAQTDGLLVVTNTSTGVVTVIDVATLTTAGRFRGTGLDSTEVLLTAVDLYVADRARGRIVRLDPVTAAPVGPGWSVGRPLADTAIDASGTVWVLDVAGLLYRLVWDPVGLTLAESADARRITGAGPESVLAAHEAGVTVFGPEGGVINQVGVSGSDVALPVATLTAPVLAPVAPTPSDLVPVTMPDADAVALFVDHDKVRVVDTAALGCPAPGQPAVHIGAVYIPCENDKVIVLDRDGNHVRDIPVAGGDRPILTVHNGLLFISVPQATTAFIVDEQGRLGDVLTFDDAIDSRDPDDPVVVTPPDPQPWNPRPDPDRGGSTGDPTPPADSGTTTGTGAGTGTIFAIDPPAGVDATVSGVFVTVTWQHTGGADRFVILTVAGAEVGSVDDPARSAVVNLGQPGVTTQLLVRAERDGEFADSGPTGALTTTGPPLPPASVGLAFAPNGAAVDVTVTWPASQERGAPVTGYRVVVTSEGIDTQTRDVPATTTSAVVTVGCGSQCATGVSVTGTVTARTLSDGASGPAGATAVYTAPPPPVPQGGDPVVAGFDEGLVCDWRNNPSCPNEEYEYTVNLSPPVAWRDFAGTCTIRFVRTGGQITERPIACDATSHYFGTGTGSAYDVSVRACLGTCVTSNTRNMQTQMGSRVWCGTQMC